jgi:Protein of unknown function (DUF1571)
MSRTLALLVLAILLAGCTRYGTNPQGGPFARNRVKPNPDPYAAIPPGPPATSSPLALASATQPEAGMPPGDNLNLAVPPRPPGAVAGAGGTEYRGPVGVYPAEVVPAGGLPYDSAAFPPRRRVRPDPQPGQLPSPFAPKDGSMPPPQAVNQAGGMVVPARPAPSPAAQNIAEIKKLAQAAADKWAKVDTYEAVVTRRELAPNKEMTEDVVLYQFRKEPMAVYIRNIGESGKGREIVYNPSKHGDKIYSIVGKGDENFLYKVGAKAPPVSPDFPLVKAKTRYSIREAGHGTPIARVANWAAKAEGGKIPAENLTYLAEVNRKEYPYPLLGVQLKLRPGDDPLMPNGGMRQWFFDPNTDSPSCGWPVLIIATEPNGKEVEYYLFEKMKLNVKLTDADFDPARLGKK